MIPSTMRVFVCASPVNMRRSFDSLATLVIEQLDEEPTRSDALFVFVNVARDKVKLLWRDENGVCLLYKRWDENVPSLPEVGDGVTHVTIDRDALARLLRGTPAAKSAPMDLTAKQVARAAKSSAKRWMESR